MLRLLPRNLLGCAGSAFGAVAAALAIGGGFLGWIGTGGGTRWLETQLERQVSNRSAGGRLEIGGLALGRGGLRIDDLVLLDASDRVLLSAGRVVADLDGWALLDRTVRVPHLRAESVVVDLTADADGVLDLSRLFGGPSTAPPSDEPFRLPVALDLPDVALHGVNVRYATTPAAGAAPVTAVELGGLDAQLAITGAKSHIDLTGLTLAGQVAVPGPIAVRAHGDLAYDGDRGFEFHELTVEIPHGTATANGSFGDDVAVGLRVDRLEARALDPVVADVGLGGVWSGSVALNGTLRSAELTAALRGLERSQGLIAVTGTVDRSQARPLFTLAAELDQFHVEHLYTPLDQPVVLGGLITVDGQGTSLPDLVATGTWRGGAQSVYGQAIDRIDGSFAIGDGELRLMNVDVDGIIGAMHLGGSIDLVDGPLAVTVDATLSPDHLARLGAVGLDGDGVLAATITTDLKATGAAGEPPAVAVGGTVTYAPFRYPNVVADRLTAPFAVRVEGGAVTGGIHVRGQGLDALGLTADTVATDDLRFSVVNGKTTVSGPLALEQVAYANYLTAGHVDVDLGFATAGAHRSLDAQVLLTEYTLLARPGTDGTVALALRDQLLGYDVALADFGRPVLDTTGSFDLGTSEVALRTIAFAPTPRATWTNDRPLRLRLGDGGITDADLALDSNLGHVAITGAVGARGPLDAQVVVRGLQLDHLAELYPDSVGGLAGALDATIALSGDAADPTIDADLDLRSLFVDGAVRWLDVAGPVHVAGGVVTPNLTLGVAGVPLGSVTGAIQVSGGLSAFALAVDAETDATIAIHPGDYTRLAHVLPSLDGTELPRGRFSAAIDTRGPLRDPVLRLAGVSELDVPGWATPGRVELDVTRRASELRIAADIRQGLATRATIAGTAATRIGELVAYALGEGPEPALSDPETYLDRMEVSAALVGVPAASLAALGGSDVGLGGDLVGGVTITGSPSTPVVEGAVNWLEPSIGGQALDGAYLALTPADGGYALDLAVTVPGGGGLTVQGPVPVTIDLDKDVADWATGDLALAVAGTDLPLGLLSSIDPRFRDGSGVLSVEGTVGGTALRPVPDLVATIAGGAFEYPDLGLRAEDVDVRLEFDKQRIRLDHADLVLIPSHRFQTAGLTEGERPRVHVTGAAMLDEWTPTAMSAKAVLSGGPWLSATEGTTLRTDGELQIGGSWPNLTVNGDLDVVYGRIQLDAAALLDDTPLRPDASLSIVRSDAPPPVAAPVVPPVYADFDVNVSADLKRNLELSMSVPFLEDLGEIGAAVTRADVATRLGGKVDLRMENQSPTLVGAVEVVDGQVRVLQSTFTLADGTITFAGGDPYADANLDLHGSMAVQGATLEVAITGTPPDPDFELTSDEYADLTEKMTILLTGKAPEELSSNQGAAATEALAGVLFNSLFAGQSFGTLTIEPNGSARLGVPVTPSVYATSTIVPMATDPNENSLAVEVEWTLLPRMVATAGIGDRRQWSNVYWEIRF